MKIKNTFSFVFLLLYFVSGLAQVKKFPDGVYLNLEQLKNQTPAYKINLKVTLRTTEEIVFVGGNDYKISSTNDSISKKYIKKNIFAYVKNDSLFLNGMQHKLQTWYVLVLTKGNFLVFKSCMTNDESAVYGFVGGAILAGAVANTRYLKVLSLRTGNVKKLKKDYLAERLKENLVLLEQFNNEAGQESETTLIKYINLLNETTPLSSVAPLPQK